MARADRERWDRKYAAGNPNPEFRPDPLLASHEYLLQGTGPALADGTEARAAGQGCPACGFADGTEARAAGQGCPACGFADGTEARGAQQGCRGFALDLACGVGHNAIFLARHGYEVVAVDASLVALRYARQALAGSGLSVHLVVADLDRFVLPERRFDVIVVVRFLARSLIPALKAALVPGGLMFYQTFNLNWLRFNPEFRREFLLEPGELARLFSDFETIETNDTPDVKADLSYWIGRRPLD
jgi:SAM-dependent methyltransferase